MSVWVLHCNFKIAVHPIIPRMVHVVSEFLVNWHCSNLQKLQYAINWDNKTCQKSPTTGPFQVIDIPATAHYVAEEWIGVEGLIGAGFETELWVGTPPGVWCVVSCIWWQVCNNANHTAFEWVLVIWHTMYIVQYWLWCSCRYLCRIVFSSWMHPNYANIFLQL